MTKFTFDSFCSLVTAELDQLESRGDIVKLWWRDDDCIEASGALDRLLKLTTGQGVPLGLAVIPKFCKSSLPDALAGEDQVTVLQHGYEHLNHSKPEGKKCEFPLSRPISESQGRMREGREILAPLFGDQFLPVFVPPWNRLPAEFQPFLSENGWDGLSQYGPEIHSFQVNTHLDFIDWKAGKKLISIEAAANGFCQLLQKPSAQPIGILSHHLVHDEEIWEFMSEFISFLRGFDHVQWVHPRSL